jgi:hypothetical protein
MRIEARRSDDGRLTTGKYPFGEETRFCVAEEIGSGTLITEFRVNGEVLDQVCTGNKDADAALAEYLKDRGTLHISESGSAYERVKVGAACIKCGGRIVRELDLKPPRDIASVPVIPMFVCMDCKSRYYALTDEYLGRLVRENAELFGKDEIGERERDERAFVNTLQEYVIRIFASKRITRLKIGN